MIRCTQIAGHGGVITVSLTREDATFLAQQLRRQLQTVENELIHTDVRRMQRELAADLARLEQIHDRLEKALASEDEHGVTPNPTAH
jgi:hypothetical protein